jgi:hypothetical protein
MIDVQVDQLLGTHASIVEQPQQSVVALSQGGPTIDCRKDSLNLVAFEVLRYLLSVSFERDGQDGLGLGEMARVGGRKVLKEGVDCSQAEVAGGDRIMSFLFEIIQEAANGVGCKVCHIQLGAGFVPTVRSKFQKQFERVPIRQHGVSTETTLGNQVLREEATD